MFLRGALRKLMACILSEDEVITKLNQQSSEAQKLFDESRRLKIKSEQLQEEFSRDIPDVEVLKQAKDAKNKAATSMTTSWTEAFLTKAEIHCIHDEFLKDKIVRMLKRFDEITKDLIAKHKHEIEKLKLDLDAKHTKETDRLKLELDCRKEQYNTDLRLVELKAEEQVTGLRWEIADLQEEMGRKTSTMLGLTQRVDELKEEVASLREEHALCAANIAALEDTVSGLRQELVVERTPKVPDLSLIVPAPCHRDPRLHNVLVQLIARLQQQHNVHIRCEIKDDCTADASGSMIALPCIVSTSITGDLKAAYKTAKLGSQLPSIIIMLHHLAPHNPPPRVASRNRISRASSQVAQCAVLITDAMYWMGELYNCQTNSVMIEEILALAKT